MRRGARGEATGGSGEDFPEAVEVEDGGEGLLLDDGGGEGGFFLLEGADLFLDGVAGDQAVGDHLALLTYAVGAVDRLGFDRGIPPRIEEDDVARGGEIQAGAGGFEREEENGDRGVGLKFIHERLAVFGLAGEEQVRDAAGGEFGADEFEHRDELRENEDLVAFGDEGFEGVEESFELGGGERQGVEGRRLRAES